MAELLDEVKDGDDREDRDEVTVGREHRHKTLRIVEKLICESVNLVRSGQKLASQLSLLLCSLLTIVTALHFDLHLRVFVFLRWWWLAGS